MKPDQNLTLEWEHNSRYGTTSILEGLVSGSSEWGGRELNMSDSASILSRRWGVVDDNEYTCYRLQPPKQLLRNSLFYSLHMDSQSCCWVDQPSPVLNLRNSPGVIVPYHYYLSLSPINQQSSSSGIQTSDEDDHGFQSTGCMFDYIFISLLIHLWFLHWSLTLQQSYTIVKAAQSLQLMTATTSHTESTTDYILKLNPTQSLVALVTHCVTIDHHTGIILLS